LRSLKALRLPLQLYTSKTQFIPLIALQEIDVLDNCKGFLVGTTNPLFLNFPKAKADIIINLDNEKVEYPYEKQANQAS
jgi:hypothetical protein